MHNLPALVLFLNAGIPPFVDELDPKTFNFSKKIVNRYIVSVRNWALLY